MPIPNDPMNRWWVDVSGANPSLVDLFRPCLINFLAFDRSKVPGIAGTGFVISSGSDFAVVISAKHVFTEGVLNIQRPALSHAPSAIFVPPSRTMPTLHPEKIKAIWGNSNIVATLDTVYLQYNETTDIACCIVAKEELHLPQAQPHQFYPPSIPLDTTIPAVGDEVHMVSLDAMEVIENLRPQADDGSGQVISIKRSVSIRIGTVTAVHLNGFRQYRWPCFTTSIPAQPGMSGGFVFIPRDGQTIAACGVVCADNSNEEAVTSYHHCGESVIACSWVALGLAVPVTIPYANGSSTKTLYDLMQKGEMIMAIGGIDHIEIIEGIDGDYKIRRNA